MKYSVTKNLNLLLQLQVSLIFLQILVFILMCNAQTDHHPNTSVTAVIVFGDSTVDPGNNNYLNLATFKANFPPYGEDFVDHVPTGRFSNGRLVTDFASSYVGLKDNVPPYLDPTITIQELASGVSFASAGSGFDSLTAKLAGVISIPAQLEYFKEYKKRLENVIGKERRDILIKNAVFVASAGTNDIVINYFGPSLIRRKTYTIQAYQNLLIQNIQNFIQDIMNEGAHRIVIVGLPPLGCLPIVKTVLNSQHGGSCVDSLSSIATDYNKLLQTTLKNIQNINTNSRFFYADIYDSLYQIVNNPSKYGIEEVSKGCCGTGYIETSFACNPTSIICPDTSKYLFFDSVHPTEKAYKIVFDGLRPTIDLVVNIGK